MVNKRTNLKNPKDENLAQKRLEISPKKDLYVRVGYRGMGSAQGAAGSTGGKRESAL